ncbi:hypothetical protein [Streptomyces sp. SudanB52_2052]|uniref:hypothetical protein n=1 Tax=Streptomyces sp. SudanB52_2052 TaxID=3035276 RepID=UPI003F557631
MHHHMLRSAATVLLASAPLFAAAPAQAAPQQNFPCSLGLQKASNNVTSTVSVSVTCDQTRTVGVRLTAGDTELANVQKTVQAGVQESVTVTVPRVEEVCATLQTGGESATICSS